MAIIEVELLQILADKQARDAAAVEIIIEDDDDTEGGPRIELSEISQEVTLSSGSLPAVTVAQPEDATRPIDVSEIEAMHALRAKLKAKSKPKPPADAALHFEDLSVDDDSPTTPLLADELTELRRTPMSEYPKPVGRAAALASLVSPKHIGRKEEIDILLETLKTVRKRGVHGVVIEGEEGVGKTRLLHTFRGLAWVKGARVAIGPCEEGGETFCGAFQEILVRLAGPALAQGHRDRMLGVDKAILYRFFPKLIAENEEVTEGTMTLSGLDFDQSALFRAVADTLRRAAEDGPLVIAVEDVHWADPGTARLATALLRRLGPPNEAPVLLVFTYRAESVTDAFAPGKALLASLADLAQVRAVALSPLRGPEMRELIRSLCVDVPVSPEVIRRLAKAARGNPRFAVEVARSVIEAGGAANDGDDWDLPTTLLAAYEQRLADLPSAARDVARCIAVLGGSPPLAIVQTASGLSGPEFEAAITELERRRVADVDRRTQAELTTLHSAALRAAVLGSISNNQARSLHRRAAAAWLKWAGRDPTISGHVARHFYAAAEDRVAIPHALRAAALADDALDMPSLKRWMGLIGDLSEITDELPKEMIYSYYMLCWKVAFDDGRLDDAGPALDHAADYAPDLRSSLETGLACARLHTRTGRYTDAVKVCRRGLREARDGGLPDFSIRFSLNGARAARRSGDLKSGLAWLAEADLTLSRHNAPAELAVRTGWTRSAVLVDLGRSAEAEAEIHRVIELSESTGEEGAKAGLRTNLSVLYFRRGAIEKATHELELAQRMFEELGLEDQVALSETNLAQLRLHQGRTQEGAGLARSAWDTFERVCDRQGRIGAGQALLFAALVSGDQGTGDMVNQALREDSANLTNPGEVWADFLMMQARWFQNQGSLAVAWNYMGRATRALGALATPPMRLKSSLLRAELMWDREQLKEALPLLESIREDARKQDLVRLACTAQAMLFATDCSLGREPQPLQDFSRPLKEDMLLNVSVHYFLWRGEEARNKPQAGATHWRLASDLADRCGFVNWQKKLADASTQN
jgi:tetratricopeptide (TPR) repeat protein